MGDSDINFHLACTSYTLILRTYIWTSNSRGRRDMVAEILCVLYLSYFIL